MAAKWKANPLIAQHDESPNTITNPPILCWYCRLHVFSLLPFTCIFSPCPSLRPGINYIISALHFLPSKVMTIFPYQTALSSKLSLTLCARAQRGLLYLVCVSVCVCVCVSPLILYGGPCFKIVDSKTLSLRLQIAIISTRWSTKSIRFVLDHPRWIALASTRFYENRVDSCHVRLDHPRWRKSTRFRRTAWRKWDLTPPRWTQGL